MLLPHLRDRAVTRIRWPHGVTGPGFFEKNAPAGTPAWVRTVRVPTSGTRGESRNGDHLVFPVVDDLATPDLAGQPGRPRAARAPVDASAATAGRATPTGWSIDLDPGEPAGLVECCQVALLVRERLDERGLTGVPGHQRQQGPAPVRRACRAGWTPTGRRRWPGRSPRSSRPRTPPLVTATMTKARRSGKVFLDWSQNAGSKTTISPYSLRGRERPLVAAPVTWAEVEAGAEDPLGAGAAQRSRRCCPGSPSTVTCFAG